MQNVIKIFLGRWEAYRNRASILNCDLDTDFDTNALFGSGLSGLGSWFPEPEPFDPYNKTPTQQNI